MALVSKPFSQACENNQQPILDVLVRHLGDVGHVLEIGSGTGQHAAFFAPRFPHLVWQTSDLAEHHQGIRLWVEEAGLANLKVPIELDVTIEPWPIDTTQAVFSANTAHIMSWPMVKDFVAGVGRVLTSKGFFFLYGPFNYDGSYSSKSNAGFDQWLKQRDPDSAIRDFEAIDEIAMAAGLTLVEDNAMPANNRLLVWRKMPERQLGIRN
jgi:cyclopropane fatty-acyl-phospholipid synthase-like methyltransferase